MPSSGRLYEAPVGHTGTQGGYALMPEWGTQPANHYLPRRPTRLRIHADELERADNPLKVEGHPPPPPPGAATAEDASI